MAHLFVSIFQFVTPSAGQCPSHASCSWTRWVKLVVAKKNGQFSEISRAEKRTNWYRCIFLWSALRPSTKNAVDYDIQILRKFISKILQLPHYFTLPYHRTRYISLTLKRWPSSSPKLGTNSRMRLSSAMPASHHLHSQGRWCPYRWMVLMMISFDPGCCINDLHPSRVLRIW